MQVSTARTAVGKRPENSELLGNRTAAMLRRNWNSPLREGRNSLPTSVVKSKMASPMRNSRLLGQEFILPHSTGLQESNDSGAIQGVISKDFSYDSKSSSIKSGSDNPDFTNFVGADDSSARGQRDFHSQPGHSGSESPSTCVTEPDVIYDAQMGFDRYSFYRPVIVNPGLQTNTSKVFSFHANRLGSQLNIPSWLHELSYENDINLRDYLSFGIQNGFYFVDSDAEIMHYEGHNYSSALKWDAFDFIDNLIRSELAEGKNVIADVKPQCIHGIGAVPKKAGGWRPITDCKRPVGSLINSFMTTTYKEFCYTTVDKVVELIQPGYFMATIDIAAAYRSILVHPSQWLYQGISWNVEGEHQYLCDIHICFGLRYAPYLFTQVRNFILRCLKRPHCG